MKYPTFVSVIPTLIAAAVARISISSDTKPFQTPVQIRQQDLLNLPSRSLHVFNVAPASSKHHQAMLTNSMALQLLTARSSC